jgi:hypothetical protein
MSEFIVGSAQVAVGIYAGIAAWSITSTAFMALVAKIREKFQD